MKSQYEKKRLITFDRIKIKSNYKYLLNTKVKFNEMFHSRSGEKIGIFYSSKDDINIPYNLYIAVSYIKQSLILDDYCICNLKGYTLIKYSDCRINLIVK